MILRACKAVSLCIFVFFLCIFKCIFVAVFLCIFVSAPFQSFTGVYSEVGTPGEARSEPRHCSMHGVLVSSLGKQERKSARGQASKM